MYGLILNLMKLADCSCIAKTYSWSMYFRKELCYNDHQHDSMKTFVAKHFEKITYFEFFQSALYFGPRKRSLKNNSYQHFFLSRHLCCKIICIEFCIQRLNKCFEILSLQNLQCIYYFLSVKQVVHIFITIINIYPFVSKVMK